MSNEPKIKRIKRRWYYVEGETGVGYNNHGPYPCFTSVGVAQKWLKNAKQDLEKWIASRGKIFTARIVRVDEIRTYLAPPTAGGSVRKRKI